MGHDQEPRCGGETQASSWLNTSIRQCNTDSPTSHLFQLDRLLNRRTLSFHYVELLGHSSLTEHTSILLNRRKATRTAHNSRDEQTYGPLYNPLTHIRVCVCLLLYCMGVCVYMKCMPASLSEHVFLWAFMHVAKVHVGCWDSVIYPLVPEHPF